MARELEVSRSTVSGWLNDRHAPRAIYLREWARKCKVPLDWLVEGDSMLPRGESNSQPAGMEKDPRPFGAAEKLAMRKLLPQRLANVPHSVTCS